MEKTHYMTVSMSDSRRRSQMHLTKVPQITGLFWLIKLLTTSMGEVSSDYLVYHINPFIAVALGGVGLAASLLLQFSVRRYVPWIYWLVVVMVAIFGTMVADATHIVMGVPYWLSTIIGVIALSGVFIAWHRVERTLSIHSVDTRRRELFYWAAVLATFALGTASGDMTAVTFHLGYFASGIVFTVMFAIPGLYYGLFRVHDVPAFWFAYILTRPVGASFADWISVSRQLGGLGLGKGAVSLYLTAMIIILVGYLTLTHKKLEAEREGDAEASPSLGAKTTGDARSGSARVRRDANDHVKRMRYR